MPDAPLPRIAGLKCGHGADTAQQGVEMEKGRLVARLGRDGIASREAVRRYLTI